MSGRDAPLGSGWSRRQLLLGGGALTLAAALPARASAGGAIRNATVLTHEGRRLVDHGLRFQDGRIVEIGPSSAMPADALDAAGAWLVPGFTDAGCKVGLVEVDLESASHDDDEATDAVTPDARVRDAYNPASPVIPVTRANGVTSVLVHPSNSSLISGQAAIFHTAGATVPEALVLAPAGLCINLGRAAVGAGRAGSPASRMGVMMRLRALFDAVQIPEEADEHASSPKRRSKKDKAAAGKPDVKPDAELSPADLAMRDLLRGRLPAILRAERADDVLAAIDLAKTWGLNAALLGGAEAHLVARQLAEADLPVLLGPLTAQPSTFETLQTRYDNAAILHAAGVRLAFRTGAVHTSRTLPTSAGVAVAYGLPFEAAITALTSGVWQIFGDASRGRMEQGADATFFLVDGDPLQPRYPVRRMWIGGAEVSLTTRQDRLAEQHRILR